MLRNFDNFINENLNPEYRLVIETDDSAIEDENKWELSIDMSDLWSKYENKDINLQSFVERYKLRINENRQNIVDTKGNNAWNDLVNVLNDFKTYDIETSHTKFDEVYDWADKNDIEIKA